MRKSIESVLKQTFPDFELIIVDDCSEDDTYNIAISYSCNNDRVRVIKNQQNRGLPASLNVGFSMAKGEYLTWTSDDNIYHEAAIKKMVNFLDLNKEYALVYADMNLIDENGNKMGIRNGGDGNLYKGNCVGACFLYKNECKKIIGNYSENKIYVEDYDYWLRIAGRFKIGRIHEILYDYRYHNNSLTIKKIKQIGMNLSNLRYEYMNSIAKNVDSEELRNIVFEMIVCGDDRAIQYVDDKTKDDVQFVYHRNKQIHSKQIWIFGAGGLGRSAIKILQGKSIEGFIDNDRNKIGSEIEGKKIISLKEYIQKYQDSNIVIAVDLKYAYSICRQLRAVGIDDAVLLYDLC